MVEIFENVKIRPHSCAKYFVYLLFRL